MDMSCDQSKYHTLMHFLCLISLKPITTLQQYDIQALIMPKSFTIVIGFMIFEKFSRKKLFFCLFGCGENAQKLKILNFISVLKDFLNLIGYLDLTYIF